MGGYGVQLLLLAAHGTHTRPTSSSSSSSGFGITSAGSAIAAAALARQISSCSCSIKSFAGFLVWSPVATLGLSRLFSPCASGAQKLKERRSRSTGWRRCNPGARLPGTLLVAEPQQRLAFNCCCIVVGVYLAALLFRQLVGLHYVI